MKTTANEFCIPGRFWTKVPARERSAEEVEALKALTADEVADWLESPEGEG